MLLACAATGVFGDAVVAAILVALGEAALLVLGLVLFIRSPSASAVTTTLSAPFRGWLKSKHGLDLVDFSSAEADELDEVVKL